MNTICPDCLSPIDASRLCINCSRRVPYYAWSTDLPTKFTTLCRSSGDDDLADLLEKLPFCEGVSQHCYRIETVLQRLQVAKVLHDPSIHDPYIEAGFYAGSGLRVYLLSTCIDILASSDRFLSFPEWTQVKKSKHAQAIKQRKAAIAALGIPCMLDEQGLLGAIESLNQVYNRNYGVRRGFVRVSIELLKEYDKRWLTDHAWICKDTDWEHAPPDEWLSGKLDWKVQNVMAGIEFARNKFTHAGQWVNDFLDKDRLQPTSEYVDPHRSFYELAGEILRCGGSITTELEYDAVFAMRETNGTYMLVTCGEPPFEPVPAIFLCCPEHEAIYCAAGKPEATSSLTRMLGHMIWSGEMSAKYGGFHQQSRIVMGSSKESFRWVGSLATLLEWLVQRLISGYIRNLPPS